MHKKYFVLLVLVLSSILFHQSDLKLGPLFDISSFILVFGSLIPIVLILARTGTAHWSESTRALGVPLGLLGGTIPVTGMSAYMVNYAAIYPASAIMLVTVLYGGVVSALGHFAIEKAQTNHCRLTNKNLWLALLPFAFIILYMMADAAELSTFLSIEAIIVFLVVFGWQILVGQRLNFQHLTEAALFSAILCLILALIQWYSSGGLDRAAINLAINGLNYGLIIYIIAYMVSLSQEDTESTKIGVGRANWHWLEVTSFMIFMLFAPETLRETLMNEQDTVARVAETELLEQRFASLEQRISDIENQ